MTPTCSWLQSWGVVAPGPCHFHKQLLCAPGFIPWIGRICRTSKPSSLIISRFIEANTKSLTRKLYYQVSGCLGSNIWTCKVVGIQRGDSYQLPTSGGMTLLGSNVKMVCAFYILGHQAYLMLYFLRPKHRCHLLRLCRLNMLSHTRALDLGQAEYTVLLNDFHGLMP